ncbi:MAG: protein kinase [Deltaproteobacteria bacterium]|nr:protein kinase [Deltaproteobacteria bacterium]
MKQRRRASVVGLTSNTAACYSVTRVMVSCPACGRSFDDGRFCPIDGTALAEGAAPGSWEGRVLPGGLRLDGVLGRGASGTVYAATQLDLDRQVAVKILHGDLASSPKMVARFEREARALARLAHPGIIAVYEVGVADQGRPMLVMERATGRTLESLLTDGPLPVADAIEIAQQLATALAHVHGAGLVHRDLKPSNVVVTHAARGLTVKLLDFGVVKRVDDGTKMTAAGEAIGTPHYMAPEQATGEPIDARTDLYALGAILFRMLTGKVPFDGTGMAVMLAHVGHPVPRVEALAPHVPAALCAIVATCLAKRKDDRFASAAELGHALSGLDDLGGFDPGVELGTAATAPVKRMATASPAGSRASTAPLIDGKASTANVPRATQVIAPRPGPDDTARTIVDAAPPSRWAARAAMVGVALMMAGLVAWAVAPRVQASAAGASHALGGEPGPGTTATPDAAPSATGGAMIIQDGVSMRVTMPARIAAGDAADIELTIWDEAGEPLRNADTVVTVTAPDGVATGVRATALGAPGLYRFHATFERAGAYVVHVFVPVGDATLTVPIDVAAPAA